jgi:hypothetical protein
MRRHIIIASLFGATVCIPYVVQAAGSAAVALNSEHVTLPDSDKMFPPGPGADSRYLAIGGAISLLKESRATVAISRLMI